MRDFQRSRLYNWERATLAWGDLLPAECRYPMGERMAQDLVDALWAHWRLAEETMCKAPRVQIKRNRWRGAFCCTEWMILLSAQYAPTCHAWYVIHELAHAAIEARELKVAAHGGQFCALYASMLSLFCGVQRSDIVGSMRAAGLKVDGRVPVPA